MYLDLANKINHDEKKQLFYIGKRNYILFISQQL